jgi:hypothetical protein
MNVAQFLFNAKAGTLDLSRARPISNKGRIDDIRRREEEQLRAGGFPKFSQLGSQNAISAEPKDTLDVNVKVEPTTAPVVPVAPTPPAPAPAPGKPILPGQTKKEEPVAPAPAPAEPEKTPAQKPSILPPYLLPSQRSIMDEYNAYLKERYGEQEALPYVDKVVDDSESFSALTYAYQSLTSELQTAQRLENQGYEYLRNQIADIGKKATTDVAKYVNDKVGANLGIVDFIRDQITNAFEKEKTNAVGAINQAIDNLFIGRPEMRSKIVGALEKRDSDVPEKNKIIEAGNKVREEYKKYKKGELNIGSWKNSDTMGAYEDVYDAYVKKFGKKPPGLDKDPLRWNNGEDDPPLK